MLCSYKHSKSIAHIHAGYYPSTVDINTFKKGRVGWHLALDANQPPVVSQTQDLHHFPWRIHGTGIFKYIYIYTVKIIRHQPNVGKYTIYWHLRSSTLPKTKIYSSWKVFWAPIGEDIRQTSYFRTIFQGLHEPGSTNIAVALKRTQLEDVFPIENGDVIPAIAMWSLIPEGSCQWLIFPGLHLFIHPNHLSSSFWVNCDSC